MNRPTIDLSAAAAAYGLDTVPPIVWDESVGESIAGFDFGDKSIHVSSLLMSEDMTDDYSEHRFMAAGAPRLDREDAVRFILAHELWHAAQWTNDYERTLRQSMVERYSQLFGAGLHDELGIEQEADKHAATAYKLVRVTP